MKNLQWDGFTSLEMLDVSQIVETMVKTVVWHGSQILFGEIVVVSVRGNLLGILHTCWCLNWSSEAIVIVALVVSERLNLIFGQVGCVGNN